VSVLPVTLPPLRDRREDIPELVNHFLERISRREGTAPKRMSPPALALMENYHWPGNVRELENVCERAGVLCAEEQIEAALIAPWLSSQVRTEGLSRPMRPGHMIEDMERCLIEQTLVRFAGHREKTAKALGIGVRTLGMKLKQWREEAAALQQAQRRAS
jgi:DNA-binding NtrC family response regulator